MEKNGNKEFSDVMITGTTNVDDFPPNNQQKI